MEYDVPFSQASQQKTVCDIFYMKFKQLENCLNAIGFVKYEI